MPPATLTALREHWPEYLIEAWALGYVHGRRGHCRHAARITRPRPSHRAIPDPMPRNVLAGVAMGLTAIALIHSPWGKRSGAHMNPAVTLTFLRFGKVRVLGRDVLRARADRWAARWACCSWPPSSATRSPEPPVSYAATLPGTGRPGVAFFAEVVISAS